MSIATDPIKVVDRNTASRIINAVIMKYYIEHDGHKDWVYDAKDELEDDYSINVKASSLLQFTSRLKRGLRDARAASCFGGKIYTRGEKDGMYREFDALVSFALDSSNYIGLPANQIIHVARKYDSVVACERDKKMFNFMGGLRSYFLRCENVELIRGDIIQHLLETEGKFSVYDIDLMTHANRPNFLDNLANGICRTAEDKAVICVVTCCGRKISTCDYEAIMPQDLICKIEEQGLEVVYNKSGAYVDQIIPMRYEFLVVER